MRTRLKLIVWDIAIAAALILIGLGLIAGAFHLVCSSLVDLHNLAWVALIAAGLVPIHLAQTRLVRLGHIEKVRLVSCGFTLVEALVIVELIQIYPFSHRAELHQRYRLQEFVREATGGIDSVTRTARQLPGSAVFPGKYIVYYDNRLSYQTRHLPNPDFPLSRLKGVSWKEPDDLGYSDIQTLVKDGITPTGLGIDESPPFSAVRTIIIASPEFRGIRQAQPAGDAAPGQQADAGPEYADIALRIWVYDVPTRQVLGCKEFDHGGRLIHDLYVWLEVHTAAPAPDNQDNTTPLAVATPRNYETAPPTPLSQWANGGDLLAQEALAGRYFDGKKGIKQDRIEAYKWAVVAAATKDSVGKLLVEEFELFMTPDEISQGKARAQAYLKGARLVPEPGTQIAPSPSPLTH